MSAFVHTLHVVLASVWLGGVVFTTAVVSPSLKALKWGEAERVLVRSAIWNCYGSVQRRGSAENQTAVPAGVSP
ncbi:MAG: hypothetical protein WKF67_13625 [Rubrobacteraceae bacterium]